MSHHILNCKKCRDFIEEIVDALLRDEDMEEDGVEDTDDTDEDENGQANACSASQNLDNLLSYATAIQTSQLLSRDRPEARTAK